MARLRLQFVGEGSGLVSLHADIVGTGAAPLVPLLLSAKARNGSIDGMPAGLRRPS